MSRLAIFRALSFSYVQSSLLFLSFPTLNIAMATSSKQQLVGLYARVGLSLPALSFIALFTGFTFSLTLPCSVQALIPAMESLFLVSVPHLWRASLSWVTPPCLFVLLNGIIVILTATSSRSFSSASDGELEPSLATQIEDEPYKQSAANLGLVLAATEHVSTSRSITTPILDDIGGALPPAHCHPAEEAELEPSYGDDKRIVLYTNSQGVPASRMAEIDPDHASNGDDPPSSSSAACEELVKGGSEPSSPLFPSSPAVKNNMRRSFSIDSASLFEGDGASEQLSEEAFKKRIEDFIFKVNSKIRSETRVI